MAGTEKQREEINRKLVSMQMELIGLTYEDAVNTPEFWRVYTLTTAQTIAWRKDALKLIQKTFKCNRRKAELIMGMFELNLGLREYNPDMVEEEYFWDVDARETTHIHTTIPPDAYILKDQQPTFWQKVKKFFIGYY
jgi:hypothetical protein